SEVAPTEGTTPTTAVPESTAPSTGSPTSEAPDSETTPNIAAASGTIVDVASASDTFQTLVSALTEAQLAEVLQGEGPFTVFAPTDEAFAALPPGILDELMKPENREILVKILKYHVVPGAVASSDLTSGEVTTAEGSAINVNVGTTGGVTVNDANVVQADIPATNGVIHAIDRVIIPPDLK
ncbi:MAG TPA: fasciclin domain-containing protein, partial [Allocoleopsis sp.]